jgi:hypothetical protein
MKQSGPEIQSSIDQKMRVFRKSLKIFFGSQCPLDELKGSFAFVRSKPPHYGKRLVHCLTRLGGRKSNFTSSDIGVLNS